MPAADDLRQLGFTQGERGANTWLVVPNDEDIIQHYEVLNGIHCAMPVQVYLDLKAHPERAAEAAEEMFKRAMPWRGDGRQKKTAT